MGVSWDQCIACASAETLEHARTQQATDDEVGPSLVAKDGHCVAQEAVQRLHHPRECGKARQERYLQAHIPTK